MNKTEKENGKRMCLFTVSGSLAGKMNKIKVMWKTHMFIHFCRSLAEKKNDNHVEKNLFLFTFVDHLPKKKTMNTTGKTV